MKKQVLIPTLIIGTLLTGSIAMASPGFGGKFRSGDCDGQGKQVMTFEQHEERIELRLEKMAAVLELTENQQVQIKALLNKNWENRQADRAEMQAARAAINEARITEMFDEADFRGKAEKLNDLKTEKMVERAKQKAEIYALLTPQQQEKADTLRGLMGGRGEGKGRHGGGGQGFRF